MQQSSNCGKLSGIGSGIHACIIIEGHGQAKILTQEEIELLFNEGLLFDRDRALFGVCLYTPCTAEACSLKVIDVFTPAGVIRSEMIIRFRQHQRQARHPHYPHHSRVEAAVRNLRLEIQQLMKLTRNKRRFYEQDTGCNPDCVYLLNLETHPQVPEAFSPRQLLGGQGQL